MRYFIDSEFYERPTQSGGSISWISIAVVAEDGREFYYENPKFPWDKIEELATDEPGVLGDTPRWLLENVRPHLTGEVAHPLVVRDYLRSFIGDDPAPQFWAWYSDYDWVVFCWLFGRMIDLPDSFPKYSRDLRQVVEQIGIMGKDLAPAPENEHSALADARWLRDAFRTLEGRIKGNYYLINSGKLLK